MERKARHPAPVKKQREGSRGPLTLRDHIDDVKGNSLARFLTDDLTVAKEMRSDEVEKAVESVPFVKTPEFYGILSILVLIALNLYFW